MTFFQYRDIILNENKNDWQTLIMNQKTAIAVFISVLIIVSGIIVYSFLETEKNETTTVIRIGSEATEVVSTESYIQASNAKITVTTKKNITTQVSVQAVTEPLMININTAQKEDFMRLSGIGDTIADEIISFRTANSGFNNIEELMCVSGIGEAKFSQIKDYVFVENPFYPQPETETEPEFVPDDIIEDISDEEFIEPTEEAHELTLEEVAPININTAEIDELMLLPYVDEDIAERIIALRNEITVFNNVYEILLVEGLSKSQCSEIMEYITVE